MGGKVRDLEGTILILGSRVCWDMRRYWLIRVALNGTKPDLLPQGQEKQGWGWPGQARPGHQFRFIVKVEMCVLALKMCFYVCVLHAVRFKYRLVNPHFGIKAV